MRRAVVSVALTLVVLSIVFFVAWSFAIGNTASDAVGSRFASGVLQILSFPVITLASANTVSEYFWTLATTNLLLWSIVIGCAAARLWRS